VGQPGDCDSNATRYYSPDCGETYGNENNVPAPTDGEIHWDENKHQAALFAWAHGEIEAGREELRVLGAISNGRGQIGGHTLRNYKALGHLVGMPDIYFLLPRGGYHGLFIELKTLERHSHLEQCQIDFSKVLMANGYDVRTCHGYRECISVIHAYAAAGRGSAPHPGPPCPDGPAGTPRRAHGAAAPTLHDVPLPLDPETSEELSNLAERECEKTLHASEELSNSDERGSGATTREGALAPTCPPGHPGRPPGAEGAALSILLEILALPEPPLVSGPALLRARLEIDDAALREQIRNSPQLTSGLELLRARQEVSIFSSVSRGQMVDSTARFLTWKVLGCPIDLSRPPAGEEGAEDFTGLIRAYGGGD
jgi:hypothetical protein